MIIEQMLRGELVQVGTPIDGKGPRILIHSTEEEIQSVKYLPLYADVAVVEVEELRSALDGARLADFLIERIVAGDLEDFMKDARSYEAEFADSLTLREAMEGAMAERLERRAKK